MKKCRIVLYGNSIIVGTVGKSLHQLSQYEVITLLPEHRDELDARAPNVVLFDLEGTRPEAAFTLLESRPGLMLIGISPDTNLVKVWSGRQLRELSTRELMEVIDQNSK